MAHTPCVLVVDDDQATREMLVEALSTHNFRALQAGDGAAMRSELEREAPDIVLLDIRLPGEDGLSLARFLRERYDVGIIMVTGSGDVIDRIVGLEIGADDYVAKPFDPRVLMARIKCVLRRIQARPEAPVANGGGRRVTGRGWRTGRAKRRCPRSCLSARISAKTINSMTQAIWAAPGSEPRLTQVV